MGDLLIRNIPDALKRKLEIAAKRDGQSLSAEAVKLLHEKLAEEEAEPKSFVSAWDVLRPLMYSGDPEEAEEFARAMEEVEAMRKHDFGRPVPDFE